MRLLTVALLLLLGSSGNAHADTQRPSTVSNVQASSISSDAISVSWNTPWDDSGIDGYNIYRNGGYYKTVFNATNFIDTGVSDNTRYEYSIVAFDEARNYSTLSSTASASTGGSSESGGSTTTVAASTAPPGNGNPAAPDGLRAESLGSNQIRLQWSAPDGSVSGYNIYRDGSYYTTVKGRTDYTATSLNGGQEYSWQVAAFSGNNYSTTSAEVRARADGGSSGNAPPPPQTQTQTLEPVQTSPQNDAPSGVPGGYRLVFSDEFRSSGLDSSKWNSRYRWGPWWTINNEQQFYIDQINDSGFGHTPFQFDGEHMTINAIPAPGNLRDKANNKDYLSGALTTYGKFTMRYGYVEMRAQLPKGKGLWPAFWLLHNQENNTRPEIDVVELIGDNPNVVYQTYHYYENWSLRSTPSYQAWGSDYSQGFHTFGMKWEPGHITWYVDGNATNSFSDSTVSSEDMYLLVNLAVGGSWPGNPDGNTSFPARFKIDYIRAYSPD